MTAAPALEFRRPDEETLQVWFNGLCLGSVNHDSVGWSGMEAVEHLMTNFAEQLGVAVIETEPVDDDS